MGFSFPTSTGVVCCSPGWKSCSVFVHLGLNSSCPSGTLYPLKRKCPPRKFRVACSSSFSSDLLLVKAARGDPVSRPPVWMMHQAGMYMAIDRKLAERYPSFRERSETTDLIVEISMQPWEAFRPDGVIIFSDILTPLPAFGFPFDIEEIRVPIIQTLIHSEARLKTLHPLYLEKLHFVGESLRLLRWEAISNYIIFQVLGLIAYKSFDSWGAQLPPYMWERWSKPYIEDHMKGTRIDVIGLDWTVDMEDGRKQLCWEISVKGNVDPTCLFSPLPTLAEENKRVVRCEGQRGHILNLGDGVLARTPEEVAHFFNVARSLNYI